MIDALLPLAAALLLVSIAARVWCIWQALREPEPNQHAWGAWPMWEQPAGKGDG